MASNPSGRRLWDARSVDGRWQLARVVRIGDERATSVTTMRDVDDDEHSRVLSATRIVATMTGNNLIKPLVDATNELLSIAGHVLEQPSPRANDPELRLAWSVAMDVWLMHVAMMRRRTEREVGRLLGDAADSHAKALFEHLYRSNPDFRLVWEWRNFAQHESNPLEITSVTSRVGENGAPQTRWFIVPEAVVQRKQFHSDVCAPRIAEAPECLSVITAVVKCMEDALSKVVLFAEARIADAAGLIFALSGEVFGAVEPGDPRRQVSAVIAAMNLGSLSYTPLRYDLAAAALLTLDAARELAGLPRVHTPTPNPT